MWCDVSKIFREERVVVQFEYDHNRDMSDSLLSYILDKESVFCWNYFSHQKNNTIAHLLISPEIDNHTPPQVNQELTCCYNHEGYEGEKADEDEDWDGFRHGGEGHRYGGEYNKGNNK